MIEVWKEALCWEGTYEVSNYGSVRSITRIVYSSNGKSMTFQGRALSACKTTGGYLQVVFSRDDKHFNKPVHRLVLETFASAPKANQVSCHNDGDKNNNRLDNLRWDTQSNNLKDRITHGTHDRGSKNPMSQLDEVQVLKIKSSLKFSRRGLGRALAKGYDVSTSLISAINVGKRWGWLENMK
jgi:hypothetical protein